MMTKRPVPQKARRRVATGVASARLSDRRALIAAISKVATTAPQATSPAAAMKRTMVSIVLLLKKRRCQDVKRIRFQQVR